MRISTLLLSAAAASTAFPAMAQVQDLAPQEALSQVQVRGPVRHYFLDQYEAKAVRGTYALSNGWTMSVTPRLRKVYVQINDGAPVELLAQSADKFASADGKIATVFNLGPWRDDMVMSYVPGTQLAERIVLTGASLAAR